MEEQEKDDIFKMSCQRIVKSIVNHIQQTTGVSLIEVCLWKSFFYISKPVTMSLPWSPSRMPKWNYIAGDLANEQSSIWSEAIAGKSRVSNDEARVYEKNKREYIKEINCSKTQEEVEDQKTRNVCSRCGKSGHMAFQCFNFLNKGNGVDSSLNEPVPSDDESESENIIKETKERSRSRSRHHSHHRHKKSYCFVCSLLFSRAKSDDSSSHHSHRRHHHHHNHHK